MLQDKARAFSGWHRCSGPSEEAGTRIRVAVCEVRKKRLQGRQMIMSYANTPTLIHGAYHGL